MAFQKVSFSARATADEPLSQTAPANDFTRGTHPLFDKKSWFRSRPFSSTTVYRHSNIPGYGVRKTWTRQPWREQALETSLMTTLPRVSLRPPTLKLRRTSLTRGYILPALRALSRVPIVPQSYMHLFKDVGKDKASRLWRLSASPSDLERWMLRNKVTNLTDNFSKRIEKYCTALHARDNGKRLYAEGKT
ncbi:MAG: hypothetical protein HZA50_12485 [Planctomycetes bacterium]|nr:hypothetical protein [Planctomycetota bacterium]